MDVRQLRALVTTVDTGSVTRAAEVLHLVQPAVTRQIRSLEQEVGVPLFERSRKGMTPTPAGMTLAERARRALGELERGRLEIQPTPGYVAGAVRVGLLESTAEVLAEALSRRVSEAQPGIELTVLIAYSGHLLRWMDEGDLDLSLLYSVASTPTLNASPLVAEELWAVAPPEDGLEPSSPVTVDEVLRRPLIMPSVGHGLRAIVEAAASRRRLEIRAVVETNSAQVQRQMVRAGRGWTILPAVAVAADLDAGLVSAAPLADPRATREILLAAPRTGRTPPAVDVVAGELIRAIRHAIRSGSWPTGRLLRAP